MLLNALGLKFELKTKDILRVRVLTWKITLQVVFITKWHGSNTCLHRDLAGPGSGWQKVSR